MYPGEFVKRFAVDAGPESTFSLLDAQGREVFTGELIEKDVIAPQRYGDFTAFSGEGLYRLRIGERLSPRFAIGTGAQGAFRAMLTHSIVKGYNHHTRADDGRRSDTRKWQDYTGGWQDAGGDKLKWTISHAVSLHGMTEALLKKRIVYGSSLTDPVIAEVKHGFDWILKLQEPAGYFGWGGPSGHTRFP